MRREVSKSIRVFLFAVAALMIMSLHAFAADDHQGWTRVTSVAALSYDDGGEYVIGPGNYYLDKNLEFTKNLVVKSGHVTICLHGHNFVTTDSFYSIIVRGGASLTIETCGSGAGSLINSKESVSATAVYVAGNSSLYVTGGTIESTYGSALDINTGTVTFAGGKAEGKVNGVLMRAGQLTIKGGEVWGHSNGVNIDPSGVNDIGIDLQGGLIAGMGCGIIYDTNSSVQAKVHIEYGEVVASTGFEKCIYLKPGSGSAIIEDGKLFGNFVPGMNITATGGLYCNDSIKAYVPAGYICRERPDDNYYSYEVEKKRNYTVTFTDGAGKTLKTQTVPEGDSAAAPAAPTRAGFTFDGWDKNFENLSGTETAITVNAKWKAAAPAGGSGTEKDSGAGTGKDDGSAASKTAKIKTDLKNNIRGFKLKRGKQKITVRWNKPSAKARKTFSTYEIQCSLKKDFSGAKKVYIKKNYSAVTLKKLKKNRKYYVRIRTRRTVGKVLHVSKWLTKSIKTK